MNVKMKVEFKEYDVTDYLKTKKQQEAYIETYLEDGTDDEIMQALSDVAKARGKSVNSSEFANDKTKVNSIFKMIKLLGLKLSF